MIIPLQTCVDHASLYFVFHQSELISMLKHLYHYSDVTKKWTDAGVTIFAVGIGAGISKEGLVAIAGNENQALQVEDFSKLANFTNTLLVKVCETIGKRKETSF
jgi:hypothetical protein